MIERRQFLRAAASGPFLGRVLGANDRIGIAQIGLGARGYYELKLCLQNPGVDIAGVCDVYEPFVREAVRKVGGHAQGYGDFRRIFDRKDIDAVFVSTPDHWHAIISILACQAGKDVYCEKPLSHTIAEGRRMVQAGRKHGSGCPDRQPAAFGPHFSEAQRLVQSGYIGKVSRVECWNFANQVRYNPNRFIWHYRWFWDYSGGMMTDWGAHHMDSVHQIMGVEAPLAVSASGGKYVLHDNRETPDTLRTVFEYPGFMASYTNDIANRYPKAGRPYGMMFCGALGTLIVDCKSYEVVPEKSLGTGAVGLDALLKSRGIASPKRAAEAGSGASRPPKFSAPISVSGISLDPQIQIAHIQNWLDCIRSRKKTVADWEAGHRSITACHLGTIAFRTGRRIRWDAQSETIVNDSEAARMMTKNYRAPWALPAV